MMLTTIDFLGGEETNIFLPDNKIGRMHTQHPRLNFKNFPLVGPKLGFDFWCYHGNKSISEKKSSTSQNSTP